MAAHEELKQLITARLGERASPLFLARVFAVLDAAENRELADACAKVGKMISLFIDQQVGVELTATLVAAVTAGPRSNGDKTQR